MHEFFDESFDLKYTFEYILSIQVSLNGFSFSIIRPNGKVLAFKQTPLKISSNNLIARRFKEWFQSEGIVQKPFKKTRIIIYSNTFTLVPDLLYSNDLKEELAHILFNKSNQLNFAENHLRQISSKLLFALPEGLIETLSETLGESEIIHPVKLVLNHLLDLGEKGRLALLFNGKDLYFLLLSKSTVKLVNSFTVNHANDVVYFVLTTLKQLGISAKNTELCYAGNSHFIGETEKNLQKYFASITKISTSETQLPEEIVAKNISLFIK